MQIRVIFRKNPPPRVQKLDNLAQNHYNLDNTNENPAEKKTMFTGRKTAADMRAIRFTYRGLPVYSLLSGSKRH